MIRRLDRPWVDDDVAGGDAIAVRARDEDVVEAQVRIPRGKSMPGRQRMLDTVPIVVTRVDDGLHGAPFDPSAAEPDERAQAMRESADVELGVLRQRVEVPGEHVEAVLMLRDLAKERAQLEHAPPLGPSRVDGAQVDAEDPDGLILRHELKKRMAGETGPMPGGMRHADTTEKC